MGDPTFGDENSEAIKFSLEQADQRFVASLVSATSGEQAQEAIEELHGAYSGAMGDSSETIREYFPKYVAALRHLMSLPEDLKQTIDGANYDLANTLIDGLPDDFIDRYGEQIDRWDGEIEHLFQDLGVINAEPALSAGEIRKNENELKAVRKKEMTDPIDPVKLEVEALLIVSVLRNTGIKVEAFAWADGDKESRLEVITKILKPDEEGYIYDLKIYWKRTGTEAGTIKVYERNVPRSKEIVEEQVVGEIEATLEEYYSKGLGK